MIGFILSIIVGGLIGWAGQAIMNVNVPGGIIGNIIVGFVGSWLGSLLLGDFLAFGIYIQDFAVIPAVIGSILVVWLYGVIFG